MIKATAKRIHREATRVLVMLVVGLAMVHYSPRLAMEFNAPALAPWGLFIGGVVVAGAVSHVMRRVLFPRLDLQSIAEIAVSCRNWQAAIVFTVICAILALLLYLNVSMLRPM